MHGHEVIDSNWMCDHGIDESNWVRDHGIDDSNWMCDHHTAILQTRLDRNRQVLVSTVSQHSDTGSISKPILKCSNVNIKMLKCYALHSFVESIVSHSKLFL